jgi:hypothetical protein
MLISLYVDWKWKFMRNGSNNVSKCCCDVLSCLKCFWSHISIENDVYVFLGHNKCLYVKISNYLVILRANSKITQRLAPDAEWSAPSAASRNFRNYFMVPAPRAAFPVLRAARSKYLCWPLTFDFLLTCAPETYFS